MKFTKIFAIASIAFSSFAIAFDSTHEDTSQFDESTQYICTSTSAKGSEFNYTTGEHELGEIAPEFKGFIVKPRTMEFNGIPLMEKKVIEEFNVKISVSHLATKNPKAEAKVLGSYTKASQLYFRTVATYEHEGKMVNEVGPSLEISDAVNANGDTKTTFHYFSPMSGSIIGSCVKLN